MSSPCDFIAHYLAVLYIRSIIYAMLTLNWWSQLYWLFSAMEFDIIFLYFSTFFVSAHLLSEGPFSVLHGIWQVLRREFCYTQCSGSAGLATMQHRTQVQQPQIVVRSYSYFVLLHEEETQIYYVLEMCACSTIVLRYEHNFRCWSVVKGTLSFTREFLPVSGILVRRERYKT